MTTVTGQHEACVGVVEHGNSAVLVTLAPGGELLDRRRIDLTRGLPTHPYHHEGSWAVGRYLSSPWARAISLPDAVALVERVRESLESLAAAVSVPISSIAIRLCPKLPLSTEERIVDNRSANVADSAMYREALALQPRRAAGACIGTTVSPCSTRPPRRSEAKMSMLSSTRWADRSGRLGRLNTNLRQLRLLPAAREEKSRLKNRRVYLNASPVPAEYTASQRLTQKKCHALLQRDVHSHVTHSQRRVIIAHRMR